MSSSTKKIRKSVRSALIQLLATVDDPKVQILAGDFEARTDTEPGYGDGYYVDYKSTGVVDYKFRLQIYNPANDDRGKEADA